MAYLTMKQLLESGVHFGHQTKRWNPKMKPYIYGARNGIYIIDLQQTVKLFREAYDYVRNAVAAGGTVLFIGTKKQAQNAIEEEAKRCSMHYINNRWIGGFMTNFTTVKKSIARLKELEKIEESGKPGDATKKEISVMKKERDRLMKYLSGVKEMKTMPTAIFVIDSRKEAIAIKEAKRLGIKVVAVVDTNCDPDEVDCIIPGNDDAIRAIKLFSAAIADACNEGRAKYELALQAATDKASGGAQAIAAELMRAAADKAALPVDAGAQAGIAAPK